MKKPVQTLARLFGRSPFTPLQTHMSKVAACVREIYPLFEALQEKNYPLVEKTAAKISKLEHDADVTKNDIRNNLPTTLFMPIARASLLEILSLQDNLADLAEEAAILLTFRPLEIDPIFSQEFWPFLRKNIETFQGVYQIILEMEELLESSFGGSEAEKVQRMVADVAFKEHEADVLQRKLLKQFFSHGDSLPSPTFYLWTEVISKIAALSDDSERLANRVRMTLEVK